jgi:dihydrofolate synthase / folylpolyglutamate synthase
MAILAHDPICCICTNKKYHPYYHTVWYSNHKREREIIFKFFNSYNRAVRYLIHEVPKTSRKVFADEATLEKNRQLAATLNNPQNAHHAIHVAGTSGKGTICYLSDTILRAHSRYTGMFVSPHVYNIRERIQLNGQPISEKLFVKALRAVLSSTSLLQPSYFEMLTLMSFYTFSKQKLDYTIIETGMGGRLDATNVITNPQKICVLGQIGLDHTEALGNTLEKIATEKAGIVQANNAVVALRQSLAINAVFETRCKEQNAELIWVEPGSDYQKTNDAMALAACRLAARLHGWQFDEALALKVLQDVFIPGRFEKRRFNNHLTILDGAHNPQKLHAVAERIKHEQLSPVTVVLSIGERQDIAACIKELKPITKRIVATEFFTKEQDIPKRPVPAEELTDLATQAGIEATAIKNPRQALQEAGRYEEPIVITGSFYLLGEMDKHFS